MFTNLQRCGDGLEILDFLRGLMFSAACSIVASGFFVENKKNKSLAYFAVTFAIVITTAYISGFEVYINYIVIAATTIAIGRNYGYLTGFSHTLTIFAVFQWGAALIGNMVLSSSVSPAWVRVCLNLTKNSL